MVELTIKVTGTRKWVLVDDMSGRGIQWNGYIEAGDARQVDIFSTDDIPGNVVVYAGLRPNPWTAQFHQESFNSPCTLELSDAVLASTIAKDADAESDACKWDNVLKKSP
ncbi:hypothetical protein [Microvirga puerhi]|uniref:Uncharacterized protein n=1 Tax=Microvirga puerhi TaxID=2876078 RepID=A0ABS7VNI5_9HYPH|nr:hypothetical protein [Microvirga puerhi]MBZ6076794.1 hypothetical protein [Microvirga puerhi]